MTAPQIDLLSTADLRAIHETSLTILSEVGVIIHHPKILAQLRQDNGGVGPGSIASDPRKA